MIAEERFWSLNTMRLGEYALQSPGEDTKDVSPGLDRDGKGLERVSCSGRALIRLFKRRRGVGTRA